MAGLEEDPGPGRDGVVLRGSAGRGGLSRSDRGFTVGRVKLGGSVCWHVCQLLWAADLLSLKPHMPGLHLGAKSYKKVPCVCSGEKKEKMQKIPHQTNHAEWGWGCRGGPCRGLLGSRFPPTEALALTLAIGRPG